MIRLLVYCCLALITASVSFAQTGTGAAPPAELVLRPGDVVRVQIWREEELSGDFPVDERGGVVLPLLGRRTVAGLPFVQFRDSLLADYQEELNNPSIVITPLRRLYVLGEVNEPGAYSVDPTTSLAGVVAIAGGANSNGDLRNIRVVRGGRPILEGTPAEHSLTDIDVQSGDQIFVGRRGWFERNTTFLISMVLGVTSIIVSVLR